MRHQIPRANDPRDRDLDYEKVERFGMCSLPVEDMAIILNLPEQRVQKLLENKKSIFYKRYRRGQALTRLGILQKQIAVATGQAQGNPGLLQHLGALLLGQDKGKKPTENKQETAEKLIQNVSEEQKAEMFSTFTGVQVDQDEKIDDSDTE